MGTNPRVARPLNKRDQQGSCPEGLPGIACESRQASLLGRREVLTGKAKFGIFGDGKEVPQIAMAKVFREGDWRSGYYRDQTFMLASGMFTLEEFFAQLYGDTDLIAKPGNRRPADEQSFCHSFA